MLKKRDGGRDGGRAGGGGGWGTSVFGSTCIPTNKVEMENAL